MTRRYLIKQREPEAQKSCCRQFNLTVPLFSVARRPRPAAHLRPTLSKPVTPTRWSWGAATMRLSSCVPHPGVRRTVILPAFAPDATRGSRRPRLPEAIGRSGNAQNEPSCERFSRRRAEVAFVRAGFEDSDGRVSRFMQTDMQPSGLTDSEYSLHF